MSVQNFDLGHHFDDLEAVVRLLGQGVSKEVKLLQKRKLREEFQEYVEVTELVVTDQQNLQELESANTFNVAQLVVLAIDFLHSEVARNVVQIL